MSEGWFHWQGNDLFLNFRIQPRASQDCFVGPIQGSYKLRITAPPVNSKANAHLINFLAKSFGVSKKQVSIIAGESSRDKRVRNSSPGKLPISLPKE